MDPGKHISMHPSGQDGDFKPRQSKMRFALNLQGSLIFSEQLRHRVPGDFPT